MKNDVLKLLDEKNIKYEIVEHEEVHTMEDMEKLGLLDKGYVCKNLFLRNANGKEHYVVSCHYKKDVHMDDLKEKLGSSRLSFGSADRLEKYLKLENGYVSPFGVINDESKSVKFVFDKDVVGQSKVGFHPNTNTATVFLDFKDVKKIIEEHGNEVIIIDVDKKKEEAKENSKKLVQAITSRDVDFAQWYTDVVKEARLCDYTSVKGCMIYMPNGYAIWENIRNDLDRRFKETGVENVYLPVLIPESLLQKEGDHVKGFAPEVAWVTEGGCEKLEERLCIRPTSEVLFCDHWQKDVHSYRDLPKVYNQWNSVLRWEKTTRPFLRSREFLWQEGHTIHATAKEGRERTLLMLKVYEDLLTESLAIPLVVGRKTESEKFAGAEETYTVEAMMHDGKALQSGTSHYFGNGFASAFDIKFLNKDNKLESPYQTSWGLSTRTIGALIMVHGDDSGLVLPPRIAPTQAMIIPISNKSEVIDKANYLLGELKKNGIRVNIDLSDKTPGWKFSEQEKLGIPVRIEIGPRDLENNKVIVVRRDNREKIKVSIESLCDELPQILETIQKDMYNRAKDFLDSHIDSATTMDEMIDKFNKKRGFIKAMWCGDENCEDEIKYRTGGAGSRCIPFNEEHLADTCIFCGKPAKHMVYWGKSY